MPIDAFRSILFCPKCLSGLTNKDDGLMCSNCNSNYYIYDGKYFIVCEEVYLRYQKEAKIGFTNSLKGILRRFPNFYYFFFFLLTPITPFGFTARKSLRSIPRNSGLIVNIGSGTKRIRSDVLNLDILPLPNVDIVAEATKLPFRDNSLDMVISEATLEHLPEPQKAIAEIRRVLKPGGLVYATAPFLYPFHESPNDYFRWTKEGLIKEFADFSPIKIGIWSGPTSAVISFLMHYFAIIFSFGWSKLYLTLSYMFMVVLAPLKILDLFFLLFHYSENISSVFYFLGKKK